jgi:hypothetical protein
MCTYQFNRLGQILLSSESVVIEVAKALFDALSKLSSSKSSGDAVDWSKKVHIPTVCICPN